MIKFNKISELIKKYHPQNTFYIIISEYAHGLIETNYATVYNIKDCKSVIQKRYKYFKDEMLGYKYIEESYIEEDKCLTILSKFEENHIFSTNIQIIGIDTEQYEEIKKTIKKIFGDKLFDPTNF